MSGYGVLVKDPDDAGRVCLVLGWLAVADEPCAVLGPREGSSKLRTVPLLKLEFSRVRFDDAWSNVFLTQPPPDHGHMG